MRSGINDHNSVLYVSTDQAVSAKVEHYADKYGFKIITDIADDIAACMVYDDNGLALQYNNSMTGAVRADLLKGRSGYRLSTMTGTAQPALKAVGFKGNNKEGLKVLDATAGLGVDGISMALAGCRVCMLEKSPVMAALLEDGLQRVFVDDEANDLAAVLKERVKLKFTDCVEYFSGISSGDYEVIYLDPMFPERQKSSKVKKEMELAKFFAETSDNAQEMLVAALATPVRRVVLKRPLKAPVLQKGFSAQIKGKSIRFDIYLR